MGLFDGLGIHPMMAMGAECALFAFIGSFLCQLLLSKPGKPWDYMNMIILMFHNALIFAPLAFYWYPFIGSKFPGSDAQSLFFKVLMDQLILSPILTVAFWFHSTFLSTLNLNKSIAAIQNNALSSLLSCWCYWPLVQFVNIGYVPSSYQVLVINLASIPWNMYVSWSVAKQNDGTTSKDGKDVKTKQKSPKKKKKKPRKEN